MTVLISVNGNDSGEGFLVVPFGDRTFPVLLGLRTDDGTTVSATLQASPDGAGVVFEQTLLDISSDETFVNIHATAESSSRNDTVLRIMDGVAEIASFNLTAISNPGINFRGRFQARFATDTGRYNHPTGGRDQVTGILGWTWTLEEEPDFVPTDSIADRCDKPVGRAIRFNNPVALRNHSPAVETSIISIEGGVGLGTEVFTVGDMVIGMPVNLGADTYFSGNKPNESQDPVQHAGSGIPEEQLDDGAESLANFEFHIGDFFSGASKLGPYTGLTLSANPRDPDDRPRPVGFANISADEKIEFGIVDFKEYNETRLTLLVADYLALPVGDRAGTIEGRDIGRRISHFLNDEDNVEQEAVSAAVRTQAETDTGLSALVGVATFSWGITIPYRGRINTEINIGPSNSTILSYFGSFTSFEFTADFLNFHADDLGGQVAGAVAAEISEGVPDFQNGIYNADSATTAAFNALSVNQLTSASIDAILGGSPTTEKMVVTISPSLIRLVVSKVVVTNPAAPPSDWVITSRDEALVGELLPEASVISRELVYLILPPNHELNILGDCEGTEPTSKPTVGYARLQPNDAGNWTFILHAGIPGSIGVTYRGEWSGSSATLPTGCVPANIEVLTPFIDFGKVEQDMTMHRQIQLLNRTAGEATVTLPPILPPFGTPLDTSVTIPGGGIGVLTVSYTAGTPGPVESTPITLTSVPVVTGLDIILSGDPEAVETVDAVLVLDRSGSMGGIALQGTGVTKARLRNEAAQVFIDLLRPDDRIGLVRYNSTAQDHLGSGTVLAGDGTAGTGKADASVALQSSDLNPSGSTSIGLGMQVADGILGGSMATKQAMVILSDGKENANPYIDDITLGSNVSAYAVGLGLPQGINVEKLDAVTGNTGGYLLVTGSLTATDEYRLQKYYAQILAGISGDDIVVDPRGMIRTGETHRIPFHITEADAHTDVVLLSHHAFLRFELEAPDGTVLDSSILAGLNGEYILGRACRYYRLRMPVFPDNPNRGLGKWNILIRYPGDSKYKYVSVAREKQGSTADIHAIKATFHRTVRTVDATSSQSAVSYSVLVRARSSTKLSVGIEQASFEPGQPRTLFAHMTAFGLPLDKNISLVAHITRPDGITTLLPLIAKGNGRFEAVVKDSLLRGTYDIIVRASGLTPSNFAIQREQTISGIVVKTLPDKKIDPQLDELAGFAKVIKKLLEKIVTNSIPGFMTIWLPIVLLVLILILIVFGVFS